MTRKQIYRRITKMSDEIKKIDEISETQNAPEIKKEKKRT